MARNRIVDRKTFHPNLESLENRDLMDVGLAGAVMNGTVPNLAQGAQVCLLAQETSAVQIQNNPLSHSPTQPGAPFGAAAPQVLNNPFGAIAPQVLNSPLTCPFGAAAPLALNNPLMTPLGAAAPQTLNNPVTKPAEAAAPQTLNSPFGAATLQVLNNPFTNPAEAAAPLSPTGLQTVDRIFAAWSHNVVDQVIQDVQAVQYMENQMLPTCSWGVSALGSPAADRAADLAPAINAGQV
ncbi:MAG TPA: hypothetical protein VH592_24650 [Gemmataceae bacterium]|jgi:hypothetical protein